MGPEGLFGFTLKEGDGDAWTDAKISVPRYFVYWRELSSAALSRRPVGASSIEHVMGERDNWLYVLASPSCDDPS